MGVRGKGEGTFTKVPSPFPRPPEAIPLQQGELRLRGEEPVFRCRADTWKDDPVYLDAVGVVLDVQLVEQGVLGGQTQRAHLPAQGAGVVQGLAQQHGARFGVAVADAEKGQVHQFEPVARRGHQRRAAPHQGKEGAL